MALQVPSILTLPVLSGGMLVSHENTAILIDHRFVITYSTTL